MEIVVYDTNIIIDLFDMGILPVLEKSGWQIHTTSIVLSELHRPERTNVLTLLPSLHVHEYNSFEQYDLLQTFLLGIEQRGNLSMADASVLLLAKDIHAMLCSNDRKLRQIAFREGLFVKGSIGIVLMLLEQRIINADAALDAILILQSKNLRITDSLFAEAIKRINEIKGGKETDIF